MAQSKSKSATELKNFTIFHNEFIETDLLDCYEKLVFMAIKRHINNNDNTAFPSIKKICNHTRLSKPTVIKAIKGLEEKHIITVEHRESNSKGHMNNLYTLYDYKEMWTVSSKKEIATVIDKIEEQQLVALLKSKGYTVKKEKEVVSATDQSTDSTSQQLSNTIINNNTVSGANSQDYKAFSIQMLKYHYDFNILEENNKSNLSLLNAIMELLLEVLNTSKLTIRVNQEDKPVEEVKGRFLKLNYMHIQYVIDSVTQQSNVKAIRSYLITSLYNSYTTIDVHYSTMINKDK